MNRGCDVRKCEYRAKDKMCLHPYSENCRMDAKTFFQGGSREVVFCNCPCIGKKCDILNCDLLKCEDCEEGK